MGGKVGTRKSLGEHGAFNAQPSESAIATLGHRNSPKRYTQPQLAAWVRSPNIKCGVWPAI